MPKVLSFRLTCLTCPEQYDVFNADGKMVAYVRLRGGRVSAECPDTRVFLNRGSYSLTYGEVIW